MLDSQGNPFWGSNNRPPFWIYLPHIDPECCWHAYKRNCCGICFHHNCVRQEFLTSKCVSCNTYTDGLLLKTVPFPDLVLIEEGSSELVRSKMCIICMESGFVDNELLATRCCRQFAHIYCLRTYCIADLCSTKDYADEATARLYSENCFVSWFFWPRSTIGPFNCPTSNTTN